MLPRLTAWTAWTDWTDWTSIAQTLIPYSAAQKPEKMTFRICMSGKYALHYVFMT